MATEVTEAAAPAVIPEADNWDERGTPIVTKKAEPTEQAPEKKSSPSKDASAASKPASESGGKGSGSGPGKKERDEERNWRALESDRDGERQKREAAEKELEDWRSGRKKAEERKTEPAKKAEPLKRPNPFTWTGTPEEYDKAMDEYQQQRDAEVATRTRQEQALMEAQKYMDGVVKQTTAKHPDAAEKIKSATNEVMAEKTPLFVKAFINDSEVIGELLYALADQTTLNNLLETAKANPGKALRALHTMELDIQKALSESEDKKPEAKSEEKAPEARPKAPPPPKEVGGRAASIENADVAAAKDGNFAAFDAEQKRKYMRS